LLFNPFALTAVGAKLRPLKRFEAGLRNSSFSQQKRTIAVALKKTRKRATANPAGGISVERFLLLLR